MDIVYKDRENCCENVFAAELSDIRKNFTDLWIEVICEKENGLMKRNDMHANLFRL